MSIPKGMGYIYTSSETRDEVSELAAKAGVTGAHFLSLLVQAYGHRLAETLGEKPSLTYDGERWKVQS